MSVNSVVISDGRPLPLNSLEQFHLETDDITEFSFVCGNGYPGSTLGYSSASGKLIITDQRIIFVPQPELQVFKSFSCPYNKISKVSLQRSSLFSFTKTYLTAKITPQFEINERIGTDSQGDLTIKFKLESTSRSVETLIKSHLFTGNVNVSNSFEPLPQYSPPIPSYEEVVQPQKSSTTEPS